MTLLSLQRCANHGLREAVARCPECGRYFCRECITEHDDKVLCADCLSTRTDESPKHKRAFVFIRSLVSGGLGFLIIWLFFYYVGRILLRLPASFHEGSVWNNLW